MSKLPWAISIAVLPLIVACGPRTSSSELARSSSPTALPSYGPAPGVTPESPEEASVVEPEEEVPDLFAEASEEATDPTPLTPTAEDPPEPFATYTLRRGESLAHFARWAQLPVEVIAEASDRSLHELLPVGTEIRVPADHDRRSLIEQARDGHHTRRAEGYLASRGGTVGTEFHLVRSGDTAWSIAKQYRLPVWLLETFNPSLDMERLRPGQSLMMPVPADAVILEEAAEVASADPLE